MVHAKRADSAGTNQFKLGVQRWCDQTWPRLYRFIYNRVQNRQEAEDFTQETYARAFAHLSSLENLPPPQYLQTIALNLIRDRWRRKRNQGIQVPLEESLLLGDSQTEAVIDRTWLAGLMAQLSADHRMVLQLRIVEGYSRAETARKMGRSEDAIRGLQYRAVQALRDLIKDNHQEVANQ